MPKKLLPTLALLLASAVTSLPSVKHAIDRKIQEHADLSFLAAQPSLSESKISFSMLSLPLHQQNEHGETSIPVSLRGKIDPSLVEKILDATVPCEIYLTLNSGVKLPILSGVGLVNKDVYYTFIHVVKPQTFTKSLEATHYPSLLSGKNSSPPASSRNITYLKLDQRMQPVPLSMVQSIDVYVDGIRLQPLFTNEHHDVAAYRLPHSLCKRYCNDGFPEPSSRTLVGDEVVMITFPLYSKKNVVHGTVGRSPRNIDALMDEVSDTSGLPRGVFSNDIPIKTNLDQGAKQGSSGAPVFTLNGEWIGSVHAFNIDKTYIKPSSHFEPRYQYAFMR